MINNISLKKIHFIGIGGIGMSGIAELMLDQGYKIQGSDLIANDNVRRLRKKGIKIFINHKKNNIKGISAAVFSSAIKKNNPEIIQCKKLSIPLLSRADMLAELMSKKNSIAIAGSHGKTTTTSLVGSMLEEAKLDPTIVNGGIINAYNKNNRFGLGKWMVVEADESDGSFIKLPHEINIITNIDEEHMDYYQSNKKLFNFFEIFSNNIPFYGYSIICINSSNCKLLAKKIKARKLITYSFNDKNSHVKIIHIKKDKLKTSFKISFKKDLIHNLSGKYAFNTSLMGDHNILNITGAIIAAMLIGIKPDIIQKSLDNFKGVKRRFTLLGKIKKSFIYDDYAHHPTEIQASYNIAKQLSRKKIIVVFQPHRYSRTEYLYDKFLQILKKIKILYILDIYPAGEKSIKKINSKIITKDLSSKNKNVFYLKKENINNALSKYYDDENIIVFMGAGDITRFAHKLVEENNV